MLLCRVYPHYDTLHYVQWQPRKEGDREDFYEETPRQVRSVKVRPEESNACNVASEGEERRDNHLAVRFIDL